MDISTPPMPKTLRARMLRTIAAAVAVLTAISSSAGIQGSGHRSLLAIGTVNGNNGKTLVVGGNAYSISAARFHVDGHPGGPGEIHKGDVVTVMADESDGGGYTVTDVTFSGSVQGRISSVDAQSGTLIVLGQTVRVNSGTLFTGNLRQAALSDLTPGEAVEASAYANSAGELVATRIDGRGKSNVARVVGSVQELNPEQHSFYINALKVNYDGAAVSGSLVENVQVTAQGNSIAADGSLIAGQVHAGNPAPGLPGSVGRIQGLVTSYSSSAYFEVDDHAVIVVRQTKFNLDAPIGLDAAITVSGTFDTNGALVADTISSSK